VGDEFRLADVPVVDRGMFVGVPGDITLAAEPTTEADPVGVYVSLLASAGVLLGPGPYVPIGNTRHPLLIWPLLFGRTGSGRKGEADQTARVFLAQATPDYTMLKVKGLTSGEGLIERIRDPKDEEDSGGTLDKRLIVMEPEFASVMSRAKREGSTLGSVLRDAWEGSALSVLSRKAYGTSLSHVSITGHITPKEFREKMAGGEMSGGTFNRFLPIYVERSKKLPIPRGVDDQTIDEQATRLRNALQRGKSITRIELDDEAVTLWTDELYDEFSEADDDDQPWTEFARRAAPYCLRIAGLHAVLDGRKRISKADLAAAAALARYSVATAKYVLSPRQDAKFDRLMRALLASGERGMTRTEISKLFSRNLKRSELEELLFEVTRDGRFEVQKLPTGGRPVEKYVPVPEEQRSAGAERQSGSGAFWNN